MATDRFGASSRWLELDRRDVRRLAGRIVAGRIGALHDRHQTAVQRGTELRVGLVALIDTAQVEVVTHRMIPRSWSGTPLGPG